MGAPKYAKAIEFMVAESGCHLAEGATAVTAV